VLARSTPAHPSEVTTTINLSHATDKQVAPRTDIFTERRPAMYRF
jgi:hypothetical protein